MNPFMQTLMPLAESAEHCRINENKLNESAREFAQLDLKAPSWRDSWYPKEDDEIFTEFLFRINSINYYFKNRDSKNKFDTEYPNGSGKVLRGSAAMIACMKRALKNGIPILDTNYLAGFDITEAKRIFTCHRNPMPALSERVKSLRNLGFTLLENKRMGKPTSFSEILMESDYRLFNNGNGIVEKLAKFPSYYDEDYWKGSMLLFYKRAHLLPMMYHGRALDSGGKLTPIKDPENFGVVTDYSVPNALRAKEILEYADELKAKIDEEVPIESGSQEEVEIRAVTAKIMLGMQEKINVERVKIGKPCITQDQLDYPVWKAGRDSPFKHHLTETTAY